MIWDSHLQRDIELEGNPVPLLEDWQHRPDHPAEVDCCFSTRTVIGGN